jgi:hypothetical protein
MEKNLIKAKESTPPILFAIIFAASWKGIRKALSAYTRQQRLGSRRNQGMAKEQMEQTSPSGYGDLCGQNRKKTGVQD